MKVIIAGGRTFRNYKLLKEKCDNILKGIEDIEIVSGGAKGADKLGERYAKEMGYKVTVFPADWDKHGKAAGMIRNAEMGKYADALIAFVWKESIGTRGMISIARAKNLKCRIIDVNKLRCKHPMKWREYVTNKRFWCNECRKFIDK